MTKWTRNDGWWGLRDILAAQQPFANSTGTFRGSRWEHNTLPSTGRMSADHVDMMRRDMDNSGIDYVVYSYATPIAWPTREGHWCSPDAGYSMTTKTKHLCRLRPAIDDLNKRRLAA